MKWQIDDPLNAICEPLFQVLDGHRQKAGLGWHVLMAITALEATRLLVESQGAEGARAWLNGAANDLDQFSSIPSSSVVDMSRARLTRDESDGVKRMLFGFEQGQVANGVPVYDVAQAMWTVVVMLSEQTTGDDLYARGLMRKMHDGLAGPASTV